MALYTKTYAIEVDSPTDNGTTPSTSLDIDWSVNSLQSMTVDIMAGAWSTTASLNASRYGHGSVGSTASGLVFGGTTGTSSKLSSVESWNGSTWSTTTAMSTVRSDMGCSGTATSTLVFGGNTTATTRVATTVKWVSSAWSTTTAMTVATDNFGSFGGSTSSALMFGGGTGTGTRVSTCYKWAGSSWSTSSAYPYVCDRLSACGTTSGGLAFGGNSGAIVAKTNKWASNTWSTTTAMNTVIEGMAGAGTTAVALSATGDTGTAYPLTTTEIWKSTAWSTDTSCIASKSEAAGLGSVINTSGSIDAIVHGGYTYSTSQQAQSTCYSYMNSKCEINFIGNPPYPQTVVLIAYVGTTKTLTWSATNLSWSNTTSSSPSEYSIFSLRWDGINYIGFQRGKFS